METNKCNFCDKETTNGQAFFPLTLIIEDYEEKLLKYGHDWNKMASEMDSKEFERINFYDQLLNTIGRMFCCEDCLAKNSALYDKYYPEPIFSDSPEEEIKINPTTSGSGIDHTSPFDCDLPPVCEEDNERLRKFVEEELPSDNFFSFTLEKSPEYVLDFCEKCFQMTNHLNGVCQKHKKS